MGLAPGKITTLSATLAVTPLESDMQDRALGSQRRKGYTY